MPRRFRLQKESAFALHPIVSVAERTISSTHASRLLVFHDFVLGDDGTQRHTTWA